MKVEVHVEIDGATEPAGTLFSHRRGRAEAATFDYLGIYVGTGYPLEPALDLIATTHHTRAGQALFGAFADCAPDRWGRMLLQRAEARRAQDTGQRARQLSEVDYLLGVRDDLRQGALRFRAVGHTDFAASPEDGIPQVIQLGELIELTERAERNTADYSDLRRLVRAGSSLGGARPKAHVLSTDGRVAIAKFPSVNSDTWNVMAWEKVAHDLAGMAGIVVPHSDLVHIDGRSVHIVDRFDRDGNLRIGFISAMTMIEGNDNDAHSYLEIAAAIEEHSVRPTADLHQLWRRIAFSVLISNTDDHPRNHAFLHHDDSGWILSPAFDLNPNPEPGPRELACAIDDGDPTATISNVRQVAPYFRLEEHAAAAILREVAEAVNHWRHVARSAGLDEPELDLMAPAFDDHELEAAFA